MQTNTGNRERIEVSLTYLNVEQVTQRIARSLTT